LTKYHLFEKAGGGIASSLVKQDGSIENNNDKVNEIIITHLRDLHSAPIEHRLEHKSRWKGLPPLAIDETIEMMKRMPRNKAISFDLIGDDLFTVNQDSKGEITKETKERAMILSQAWDEGLLNSQDFHLLLQGRLIPLNKKFLQT